MKTLQTFLQNLRVPKNLWVQDEAALGLTQGI